MQHSANHERIIAIAGDLQAIAKRNTMDAINRAIASQVITKLEDHRFHVLVAGEFANGKTTLVNALLGVEYLPSSAGANSSRIVEIVHSNELARTLVEEGRRSSLTLPEFQEYAQDRSSREFHLELATPSELCRDGVILVDTPGLQDVNKQRVAITFNYLPKTDLLIYVADATSGIKESEYEFLGQTVREFVVSGVMVALNKVDNLGGPEDIASVLRKTEEAMAGIFGKKIPVFPVSSIKALDAMRTGNEERLQKSGLPAITGYLQNFLENERFDAVVKAAASHLTLQATSLSNRLNALLQALAWNPAQHAARTSDILNKTKETDQHVSELKTAFQRRLQEARQTFTDDFKGWLLNDFRLTVMAKLKKAEISDLTADNVKDVVMHYVGVEFKKRWQTFSKEIEKLIQELGSQSNASFARAGADISLIISEENISSSPIANVPPLAIAAALAGIAFLFTGVFTLIATLFVAKMLNVMDFITDWQKDMVLKSIDDALRQALPKAAEQIEAAIAKACTKVEEDVLSQLAETRMATLGALAEGLEQAKAERVKGEQEIETRKSVLIKEIAKAQECSAQLLTLV